MPELGPFEHHVREAIALNRRRRAGYVREGGVRAALVSRILVGAERALLPTARRMDRRAETAGCGAVWRSLFAPMSDAPDADRTVAGTPRAVRVCLRLAARLSGDLREASREISRQPRNAQAALQRGLDRLRAAGRTHDLHLAMSVHLLESALLATSRIGASAHSRACRDVLARFVRLHTVGVPLALGADALAAPLHARGVGILANDLPPIPPPDASDLSDA